MQNINQMPSEKATKAGISPSSYSSRGKRLVAIGLSALGAGFTASLVAVVVMGILRLAAGVPTPIELFGDHVLKLLPVATFVRLLITFGRNAKIEPLGLTLLAMIGVGTLLGLIYAALVRVKPPLSSYWPARRDWLVAAILVVVMTLAGVVLFWGELGQNFLGLPLNWASLISALSMLLDFGPYGVTLCIAYRVLLPKKHDASVPDKGRGRRELLARAGVAAVSLGAGVGTLGLIRGYLNSNNFTSYDGLSTYPHNGVTAPITPNNEHYVVTQNPIDPSPNIDVWQLEVTGLVGSPGVYNYTQLKNLPSTSRAITLECISNEVGGHLISTVVWQGVTLNTLLTQHGGALPNASYVAFYSVDGYSVSLPLHEVLDVDALLAWQMNGVELPNRHGFPLRVLVPGRFGEENPKWLTRVELTDHFVGGLYSDQGWYNGPLHLTSRIDRPQGRVALGQTVEVGGIAFSGSRGIQQVEVSTDKGVTWNVATLQPALSPDAWVLWTWVWRPMLPGQYTLMVRATDGSGELQTAKRQGTVPNGATGYHQVVVMVGQ